MTQIAMLSSAKTISSMKRRMTRTEAAVQQVHFPDKQVYSREVLDADPPLVLFVVRDPVGLDVADGPEVFAPHRTKCGV